MDDVSQLLQSAGLEQYARQLQDAGYDDAEALTSLASSPGFVSAIIGDTGMRIGHARRLHLALRERAGLSSDGLPPTAESASEAQATSAWQEPGIEMSGVASRRERSSPQADPDPPPPGATSQGPGHKSVSMLKSLAALVTLVGVMSSIALMLFLHNATVSLLERSFASIVGGGLASSAARGRDEFQDVGRVTWAVKDALPKVEGEGLAIESVAALSTVSVREWCAANPRCVAFAHRLGTDMFFAKRRGTGFDPLTASWKTARQTGGEHWQWHYIKERAGSAASALRSISLYCFTLTLPYGYELPLLANQQAQGVGLFGCDEFDVFTNTTKELGVGKPLPVNVSVVSINLDVPLGGRWHTALNTPTLLAVWKEVGRLARYTKHDWIVKLDIDTVFLPERLKQVLRVRRPMSQVALPGGLQAMYLNNCEYGLHGPIEILSREAVSTFLAQMPRCDKLAQQPYGEDTYLDHCLRMLGVTRVSEFSTLNEKACGSNPAPCGSAHVAFHPFKTTSSYFGCWGYASKYGIPPEEEA